MSIETENYVKVFNESARSGDWSLLAGAHTDDGVVEFEGVPVPTVRGRAEIEAIYREYPQGELTAVDSRSEGDVHEVDYKFVDGSASGRIRLTYRDGLVAHAKCSVGFGE